MAPPKPPSPRAPDFFERITEASIQVTFVIDASGRFTYVSSSVRDVLGYEPEALVGEQAFDYLHPANRDDALAGMAELAAPECGRVPWVGAPMAFTIRRADGTWFSTEVGATNMFDDPEVRGMVCRIQPHDTRRVLDDYLEAVATNRPLPDVLDRVAESTDSDIPNGRTSIAWQLGPDGFGAVAGAPLGPELEQLLRTGTDPALPWIRALALRAPVVPGDLSSAGQGDAACWPSPASVVALGSAGVVTCWAIPVALPPDGADQACVVVWRDVPGAPLVLHRRALERAPRLVRLAFERQAHLDRLQHRVDLDRDPDRRGHPAPSAG